MDDDMDVKCPKCGWKDKGSECASDYDENWNEMIFYVCPECDTKCVPDE